MARNVDKRLDPRLLVSNAQSVVSLLVSYKPVVEQKPGIPKIARYAYSNDYHLSLRSKLHSLLALIKQQQPQCEGRGFVDSAPVLERAWAVQAGLGWIGKSGLLISPTLGSYTFIAELIINLEVTYDPPFEQNLCGSCTRCMQACLTGAIVKPCTVDARKCISYQTIEHKGEVEVSTNGWLFGCDLCQEVCPWNKKSAQMNHPEFEPIAQLLEMEKDGWERMDKEQFDSLLQHSPIQRTGFGGIQRNLKALEKL